MFDFHNSTNNWKLSESLIICKWASSRKYRNKMLCCVFVSHFCGSYSDFFIQVLSIRDGDSGLPKMLTFIEEHNHNYQGTMFISCNAHDMWKKETDTEIITTACLPHCSSLYLAGAQQPSVMIKMIKHAIWFRFGFCSFLSNIVRQRDSIAMITMVFPYYNKLIILPILVLIHNDGYGQIVKISGFMCIFCLYKGCVFPGWGGSGS